jgi:hypothetical protein
MRKTYTLAILATLALGTVALAQPGKHGRGKLERLDANKDGQVTLAEMKSVTAEKFQKLDADKDGRVVKEELAAHHEQMRAKWAQKFADKNAATADGKGDRRGKWDGKKHGKKHGHMGARFFEKMDSNGDGAIDAAEFTSHVEQKFARMDANGDKVLAGAELEHRRGKHGKHGKCGDDNRGRAPQTTGAAGGAG